MRSCDLGYFTYQELRSGGSCRSRRGSDGGWSGESGQERSQSSEVDHKSYNKTVKGLRHQPNINSISISTFIKLRALIH